ncbi:MAG: head-tail adaptor protein [Rhodobacteraceae bacterium]|nr:head-tail adaptor protein [Paracoccaceae bacterium]
MQKMTNGHLKYRLAFDAPNSVPDGHGGTDVGWLLMFVRHAGILFLRGGETVQASRLQGRQPAVITIRNSVITRKATAEWRIRDLRRGQFDDHKCWQGVEYNVRAIVPSDDDIWLEITAESGVAT